MERLKVRVADPEIAALPPLVAQLALEMAERVAVPGRDVEVGRKREVVEVGEAAHEVVQDVAPGGQAADDLDLPPVEDHHRLRGIAPEGELLGGIRFGHGEVRQLDLVEGAVFHRPEDVTPGPVERVDGSIARRAPGAEAVAGRRRVAQDRVVTAVFVVDLPGDQGGVVAEGLGQDGDDARALVPVARMAEAVVPACAEAARPSLAVDGQHVRAAVDQPFGGTGGRRAEHDLQAGGLQGLDRAAQPVEPEVAGRRLQPRPGELADPHHGDAGLAHHGGVGRPAFLGPMLRVVADPERGPPRGPLAAHGGPPSKTAS